MAIKSNDKIQIKHSVVEELRDYVHTAAKQTREYQEEFSKELAWIKDPANLNDNEGDEPVGLVKEVVDAVAQVDRLLADVTQTWERAEIGIDKFSEMIIGKKSASQKTIEESSNNMKRLIQQYHELKEG